MDRNLLALLALPLAGCSIFQGSIFDPAPYNPQTDPVVLNSVTPPADPLSILTFGDPPTDARPKLQAMANGYASQRDGLMRQQLIFDVPLIGLGAAAIVNPLFEGRKNVTLALSLGAAGVAGGRLYFGPQAKEGAYNAAWLSLTCASLVADSIVNEKNGDGSPTQPSGGPKLVEKMTADIAAAEGSISSDPVLLAAYNQAQKSLAALQTALASLSAATNQLEQYGLTVIATATNKVVGSVQNVSAVTAALAAATKPAPTPATFPSLSAAQPVKRLQRVGGNAQLILDLQDDSATADAMAQRINTVLQALPKCTPS